MPSPISLRVALRGVRRYWWMILMLWVVGSAGLWAAHLQDLQADLPGLQHPAGGRPGGGPVRGPGRRRADGYLPGDPGPADHQPQRAGRRRGPAQGGRPAPDPDRRRRGARAEEGDPGRRGRRHLADRGLDGLGLALRGGDPGQRRGERLHGRQQRLDRGKTESQVKTLEDYLDDLKKKSDVVDKEWRRLAAKGDLDSGLFVKEQDPDGAVKDVEKGAKRSSITLGQFRKVHEELFQTRLELAMAEDWLKAVQDAVEGAAPRGLRRRPSTWPGSARRSSAGSSGTRR